MHISANRITDQLQIISIRDVRTCDKPAIRVSMVFVIEISLKWSTCVNPVSLSMHV